MGWMMRPLLVVETTSASDEPRARATLAVAVEDARDAGCQVVRGWVAPLGCEPVVCTGSIRTTDDARRALLAAIAGAGLAVRADGDRRTIDQLVDDLRRLGDVEHVTDFAGRPAPLLRSQRAILALVREGLTIREAADLAGISVSGMKSRVQRGRAQLRDLLEACCAIALDSRGKVTDVVPRVTRCTCDTLDDR
jgi:methylmalonyl-CoA mutase cobalamin-binding subunit